MVFVLVALINMRHLLAASKKMSNVVGVLVVLIAAILAGPGLAQFTLAPLSQSEVEGFLFGQKLIGEYSNGERWNEELSNDLSSDYADSTGRMTGRMGFDGAALCFTYAGSSDPGPHCFEIWKRGHNCFDFYGTDGQIGLQDRRFGRGWMARAWRADQPSSCRGDLIS